MAVPFATDAWIQALQNELNSSPSYQEAARDWEGDFYFVIDRGEVIPEDIYLYMDLQGGGCQEAYRVEAPEERTPEFVLRAPLQTWQKVVRGEVDPIRGLMLGQFKLKGNLMKLLKTPKAATELVACCTQIDTEWPV